MSQLKQQIDKKIEFLWKILYLKTALLLMQMFPVRDPDG